MAQPPTGLAPDRGTAVNPQESIVRLLRDLRTHRRGTATPDLWQVLLILPFPLIVWDVDELRRWNARRRIARDHQF